MAQGISMIAIPWYFTKMDETATFGWIYWVVTAVSLIWSPTAGIFIDKYSRKNIFLALCAICGTIILCVALYGYSLGRLPIGFAAIVFALTFFNYNLHYPALYAFLQEITEPKDYGFITSAVEVQGQLTSVLAGAGAALLLEGIPDGTITLFGSVVNLPFAFEAWELHEIFAIDGATYFLAFLLILFVRYKSQAERYSEFGSLIDRLKVGLNYLRDHPYVFLFGVASYSIFVTVLLITLYMAAIYVANHLQMGGDVYAVAEVCFALGAIFAGFAIRKIFSRTTIVTSIIIMTSITAMLYGVLVLSHNEIVLYGMFFILGLSNAGTRIQRVTYLFRKIPNQVYGRANSIFVLTNILWRVFFLAIFALPFFHEDNNVIFSFAIMSLFLILTVGVLVRFYGRMVGE